MDQVDLVRIQERVPLNTNNADGAVLAIDISRDMRYTIYKVTNKINGKYYIGKHQTTNIMDNYLGSGKAIKNAIKIYGKDSFIKEILFDFDNEYEMNCKEKELITEKVVLDKMSYNLGIGGEGGPHFKDKNHSEESKRRQSLTKLGTTYVYNYTEKRKDTFFKKGNLFWKNREQKPVSDETRQKIREKRKTQTPPNLGKKLSEEHKEKIRQSIIKRNKPV